MDRPDYRPVCEIYPVNTLLKSVLSVFGGRIGLIAITAATSTIGGGTWLYFKTKYYNHGVAEVTRTLDRASTRFRIDNARDNAAIMIEDERDESRRRIEAANIDIIAREARQRLMDTGDSPEAVEWINRIK